MFSAVCVAGTLSKYFTQHTYFYPPKNSLNWATGISIFLTRKQKDRVISELREPSLSQWVSKDCTWVSDFQTDTTLCLNGHTDKAGYMAPAHTHPSQTAGCLSQAGHWSCTTL